MRAGETKGKQKRATCSQPNSTAKRHRELEKHRTTVGEEGREKSTAMACLNGLSLCPSKSRAQPHSPSPPSSPSFSSACCFPFGSRKHRASQYAPIKASGKVETLKVMISGAPASGKGTQCEFIKKKYGLVHIAAGDLLREEVGAGTENGKQAKEYMEKGMLVPDDIVVMMVKDRLFQTDVQVNGWLLDGYPRSLSQARALEDLDIHPDIFILLDVSEESLIERVVGRRLDPVTGKIYHLKYSPPETEEIAARLTQRFDDTEEKVKLRLQTYHQNLESVLGVYKEIIVKVNGNAPKEQVFAEIDCALSSVVEKKWKSESISEVASVTS